jgi:cellulose synthase/poly-beta-1,6-N-acetylglucosamine synthase-like glycosyltransferase
VRVLSVPHTNIATGRNKAIEQTDCDVIAVTDAGTVARPDWLEKLVEPFEADATTAVSAGFFEPGGATFFERCLTTIITPQLRDVDSRSFLPSSRSVAFRREWWARVHGYPEWLRYCEDLVFDLELKRANAPFVFVPDAIVVWSARRTLRQFFRQYASYARGDGHARLYARRHGIRYTAYILGLVLLLTAPKSAVALLALALGVAFHFRKFARRIRNKPPGRGFLLSVAGFLLIPLVVVSGDIAKMIGYPLGLFERRRKPSPHILGRPLRSSVEVPRLSV